MYVMKVQRGDLTHHGILGMKWGIRRYQPYSVRGRGSGKKGKEIGDAAKAKQRQERIDKAKKIAATVGSLALKSALTGATVAAKVVFSSAITSATLLGIAAAGYQTITSPEMSQLINNIGVRAGTWFVDKYTRQGVAYANQNLDELLRTGDYYLRTLR